MTVLIRTIIALEKKQGEQLLYQSYMGELLKNLCNSQGGEVKKGFMEMLEDYQSQGRKQVDEETAEETIEKVCNKFRALNK